MATLSDEQARTLYPRLRHYAMALSDHDSEDLVQDALLGLLRRPELPEHLAAFACMSIRHAVVDRYRRERCLPVGSLDAPTRLDCGDGTRDEATLPLHTRVASATDVAEEVTMRALLDDALAALAGESYAPALIDFGRGYRYRELAAREGVSIMAVKSGLNRLRHGPLARLSPY